jgi:hypothetical protein
MYVSLASPGTYNDTFKPPLKEMSGAVIMQIELSCIGSSKPLHAFGQVRIEGFQKQMVMIPHQNVSIYLDVEAFGKLLDQFKEQGTIIIRQEDILPAVSSRKDMILRAGIFYLSLPCHKRPMPSMNLLSIF